MTDREFSVFTGERQCSLAILYSDRNIQINNPLLGRKPDAYRVSGFGKQIQICSGKRCDDFNREIAFLNLLGSVPIDRNGMKVFSG